MKFAKLIPAALALGMMATTAAHAAPISFTADQGLQNNGLPVADARSDTDNMTDGDINTFYSLGIGGSLTASIAPLLIASASVIEVTFGNSRSYPEAVEVYLGTDSSGPLLGTLFNAASGTASTSAAGTITASPNTPSTGLTSFLISLNGLSGSALHFLDITDPGTVANADGFDIAELGIAAVPLPAGAFLLIGGLGGLVLMRRRQKNS